MLHPEPPLSPGTTFDRYVIEELIGEGGMGRVYRARDQRLQRTVALKVLRYEREAETNGAARLVREARAAAALNHPNAVSVFDAGEHDGRAFIAMELIAGKSMRRYVGDESVSIEKRIAWLADVARALVAAHAEGLMHRDIKPENVVVRDDGVVKVLDFGIARRITLGTMTGDTVTQEGTLVGTPLYMAPEQLSGATLDERVDQFAWGILAYELLAGERPWQSDDLRVIAAILQQAAPPLGQRAPNVPPHVEATIHRALAKAPDARFATMSELLASLEGKTAAANTAPAPPMAAGDPRAIAEERTQSSPARSRTRTLRWIAIALTLGIAGASAFAIRREMHEARAPVASPSAAASGGPVEMRRSFAVVGVRDRMTHADGGAWRATATAELLNAELVAGDRLRGVPGERVARARIELALGDDADLDAAEIVKLGENLGVDRVLSGALSAGAGDASGALQLQVTLFDARTGAELARVVDQGSEEDLFPLVARVATSLRGKLGIGEPSSDQRVGIATTLPANAEAARLYAEAIQEQRRFHDQAAVDLFEQAVKLEPRFALAYAHESEALARMGHAARAREEAKAALDLASGLPREERLWVEATYHAAANEEGDAARTYEALLLFFPDNVDYAIALLQSLAFSDKPKDSLAEIARLRTMPAPIADDPRVDYEEARAAHMTSDYEHCLRAALRCRQRASERGMRIVYAKAGYFEGIARINLGQQDEGLRVLEDAGRLARSLGDNYTANVLDEPVTSALEDRGELARARELVERSRAELEAMGNTYWAVSASEQLGHIDVDQGNVAEGRRTIEKAIEFYRKNDRLHALTGGLTGLARIVAAEGDPRGAEALANEALLASQKSGRKATEGGAHLALAFAARVRGDAATEKQQEDLALAIYVAGKMTPNEADAHDAIGTRAWLAGDFVTARSEIDAAVRSFDALGLKLAAADARIDRARVALDEGRADDAEALARQALAVFDTARTAARTAMATAVIARARAARADKDATHYATDATALVATTSDGAAKLRVRLDLARAHTAGNPAAARAELAAIARDATAASRADFAAEARAALATLDRQ